MLTGCNGIEDSDAHSVDRRRPLQAGEVHVWLAAPEHCLARRNAADYAAMLSADETERMRQFRFEHLRNEFLITRVLCRSTLSRYADVDAEKWKFRANAHGKPEIAGPGDHGRLRFNLSNARGLVACAVSLDVDIGVDVEETDRKVELSIAEHYFSRTEVECLRLLPRAEMERKFIEIWTLKESYIKARGLGLSLPLDEFSFRHDAGAIHIDFSAAADDLASDWQFAQQAFRETHLLALAIRRGNAPAFRIHVRETIP
jgi:4'-phosphopantetheinyl transferase